MLHFLMHIRLTPDLAKLIKRDAKAAFRNPSAEVCHILTLYYATKPKTKVAKAQ